MTPKHLISLGISLFWLAPSSAYPPNIILVLADDMGNAQVGYRDHPILKTPHIDALAAGGMRLDRFYAAGPVCSPTRASLLTGRHPVRCGVPEHGYPLRPQEWTLPAALQKAGYATGHFGKWHLNGLRGPGAPIAAEDPLGPGRFGFERWVSTTNYFDIDPILSHGGTFIEHEGDSSEIIVDEALKFVREQSSRQRPFFAAIWYGSPHSPFRAFENDVEKLKGGNAPNLDAASRHHHGELVAMDRSIGTLMRGLGELEIDKNTLVWFTSDNGGLPRIEPSTVGKLKGHKGTLDEGGLRVPCVVHWPGGIAAGQVDSAIAGTVDFAPTVMQLINRPELDNPLPRDGVSLIDRLSVLSSVKFTPPRHLGFKYKRDVAVIGQRFKQIRRPGGIEYYDLQADPHESHPVLPPRSVRDELLNFETNWLRSVSRSVAGSDYSSGVIAAAPPQPMPWYDAPRYQNHLETWRGRPEYESWLKPYFNRPRRSTPTGSRR